MDHSLDEVQQESFSVGAKRLYAHFDLRHLHGVRHVIDA